jgi:hypothetical protein
MIKWREVESSNVDSIGWDDKGNMYVRYIGSGKTYMYVGVPRQRAVAASRAKSVGSYIARHIKGRYEPVHIG